MTSNHDYKVQSPTSDYLGVKMKLNKDKSNLHSHLPSKMIPFLGAVLR